MSQSDIIIHTALPGDYHTIAALEAHVFSNDNFCIVGFGPLRGSERNIAHRARGLSKELENNGKRVRLTKAVRRDEKGEEEIVGAALWNLVTGRNDGEEKDGEKQDDGKDESPFVEGANVEFLGNAFSNLDQSCDKSCEGKDYASEFNKSSSSDIFLVEDTKRIGGLTELNTLVVNPTCQRKGIGSLLLDEGLREIDAEGLQCVLGASQLGRGLYKKHGFIDFETLEFDLSDYEGGEGKGVDTVVIMHRPARKP